MQNVTYCPTCGAAHPFISPAEQEQTWTLMLLYGDLGDGLVWNAANPPRAGFRTKASAEKFAEAAAAGPRKWEVRYYPLSGEPAIAATNPKTGGTNSENS